MKGLLLLILLWGLFVWFVLSLGTPTRGRLYMRDGKKVLVRECPKCDSLHTRKPQLAFQFK